MIEGVILGLIEKRSLWAKATDVVKEALALLWQIEDMLTGVA